ASADQSVIDFDIPFSIAYVIGAGIEILATIAIMVSVNSQVLIVAIIAVAASKYAQRLDEFPQRETREVPTSNADILQYDIEDGVDKRYLDSAFRSTRTNEAYLFFHNEYVVLNYAPGTTNDRVVNGPLYIQNGFHSLVATPFAEYGIDAAFGCHDDHDESFIFSGSICAKIDYAPGTTNDKILEGLKTIRHMFPFFKGTKFQGRVDAALESTVPNEVYIFKGAEYALVDYIQRKLISIRPIVDGFKCLHNTIFDSDIGAAFASHNSQEAYLFKGNSYVLLHFTPWQTKDYIISGPKEILPNKPSLVNILPRDNAGVDIDIEEGSGPPEPEHDPPISSIRVVQVLI
ncbi:hemopexin fold protein, partial [Tanacetum coccineum]